MKGVHIGHDCHIWDDVIISCGAKIGGHTYIMEKVNIGLNAVIHQRQTIAEGCMIGMGSVVTKKLITKPYSKYAGNPAKYIGSNESSNSPTRLS
jgi:UDP-N-acetylglucosamine acyltransferase